jgi:hypothetical protein
MWHNLLWIGGIWLVALVFAWLICHWRGYKMAAWAFTISAFCLGLFVGTENATHGRFKVPFLSSHHHRHFTHRITTANPMMPIAEIKQTNRRMVGCGIWLKGFCV